MPGLWNYIPDDPVSISDRLSYERAPDNKYVWNITSHYAPFRPWEHQDPLSRWPRVTFPFRPYREPLLRDINNVPIQNSAKQPFDPPLEEEYFYLCVDIARNVSTFDPTAAWDYKNSVNSATITVAGLSIPAGVGLIEEYSAGSNVYNGPDSAGNPTTYYYYDEHIRILLTDRPWLWKKRVLDMGVYDVDCSHMTDGDSAKIVTPFPLDGSGHKLACGQTPVFLPDIVVKKQKAWANISPALPATVFPSI